MNKQMRSRGFTLVELMVVLVVVGILSAIAIPSYTQYILRSHRTSAQAVLAETAQFMERFYTTNNSYEGAALVTAVVPRNAGGAEVRYNVSFVEDPDADGFMLQAVPANAQADDECGTLTLSGTGAQGADASGCW
ncbi:type IV pilin protein [Massilia sp. RP-1-19]|uniref:Type IV pilin protein n=1 Tax=Massilia polaris TaxID=2728846 RepID=A0A848HGE9_9BURK|nr:type IV pilin protein [Massilia polaris]NML60042.1 type IV pilin protein [Massilia polaris]